MGKHSKTEAKWQIAVTAEVELVRSIQGARANQAQWIAVVEASDKKSASPPAMFVPDAVDPALT